MTCQLQHTTINKAINDFRKRLNACVLADGGCGHFDSSILCELGSRAYNIIIVKVGDN